MHIHKEGSRTILWVTLFTGMACYAAISLLSDFVFLKYALVSLTLLLFGLVVYFFRINERKVVVNENAIVSSCDGKVVAIEPVDEQEYFGGQKKIQVSVFMSPTNIHANWWPVNGIVEYYKHHNGKFRVAWHPKSSTENERSSIVVKTQAGNEMLIRQIAGALARRIVTYASKEQTIQQGEELGFIKFGSRVDFILPADVKINVKIGDVVTGTQSIIAYWK